MVIRASRRRALHAPPELLNFRFANFGLTFEDQGLRARLTLDRDAAAAKPEAAGKTEKAKPETAKPEKAKP